MSKTVSAIMAVFNEENRIRYTLESLKWCDEIIIVDKTSSDKTVEICKEYGAKINIIPNSPAFDPKENKFISQCSGDWIMLMTASDIIDKSLAMEIKHQIEVLPDNIKCINVPFRNYILGINDQHSPWYDSHRLKVFRRNNFKIENDVHGAFHILDYTSYTIPESFGYFSHLTHVSVDMMLDRHSRYWRGEGNMYDKNTLRPAYNDILNAIDVTLRQRKTYQIGWDGIALTMAYVSYYMFSFLYKWEHLNNQKAKDTYRQIREDNFKEWNNDNEEISIAPNGENTIETSNINMIVDHSLIDVLYYYKNRRLFRILCRISLKILKIKDYIHNLIRN